MKTSKLNLTERAKNGRNGVQLVYVLDCIKDSSRAFDENLSFSDDHEVMRFFFDCFNEEYNNQYNKRLFPSLQNRIAEYLKGLPSCCDIDYWNDEIIKHGVIWGVLSSVDDKRAGRFAENWFNVVALRILQVAQKVGINPYKYSV